MTVYTAREVIDRVLADFMAEVHTSFPAQVIAYDAAAQTVDVRPAIMREQPNDDPSAPMLAQVLPDLYGVPIMWPRGGGFVVTFPIEVGDWVKVDCAEQSTIVWRVNGDAPVHPGVFDAHGLNGCVAIPGWYPDTERLAGSNVSLTDLCLQSLDGATSIRITPDGQVVLGAVSGAQYVALANLVQAELARLWAALESHAHGVAGAATGTPNTIAAPLVVAGWADEAESVTMPGAVAATKTRAK